MVDIIVTQKKKVGNKMKADHRSHAIARWPFCASYKDTNTVDCLDDDNPVADRTDCS